MSLKTRYNLFKAKRSMSPDGLFKANLSKKLSVAWDGVYNTKYAWYQTVWIKRLTVFASVVLIVGSLGAGAYAYTSPTVTKGSVLYPIKDKLENIEEIIKITPEAKAKFYLKNIARREAEFESVKKRGDEKKGRVSNDATRYDSVESKKLEKIIDKQIEQAEKRLETAGKKLEEIKSADSNLKIKVKDRLKKRESSRRDRQESD